MTNQEKLAYQLARDDFYDARRKAVTRLMLARLRGERERLLSYEDIRRKLKADIIANRKELREIPLDSIVGSVNRFDDFTRDFFPIQGIQAERWASVSAAGSSPAGLPPIEVYQIGEAYFVNDGNHRVAIARQAGLKFIQAYVTEVRSRVALDPADTPEDIILKAGLIEFLEHTHLDLHRPAAEMIVTVPEAYNKLIEHVSVHQHYMSLEQRREVPFEEAAVHWYDSYYLPNVELIESLGLPRDFPGKTPADLYLWLCDHRAKLEEKLGGEISHAEAAVNLVARHSTRAEYATARLLDAVLPDSLEGTTTGSFRKFKEQLREEGCLFSDILVPVNGTEAGWHALEQALVIARYERARLRGLHVVASQKEFERPDVIATQQYFNQHCADANVRGSLTLAEGEISRLITERAALNDLVVLNLAYPPGASPIGRLTSGYRTVVQRSPRPVLAVPQTVSPLHNALLAYDGSATSQEALFVAAYLAARWNTRLTVLTILEGERVTQATVEQARNYLETRNIQANFVQREGPPAQAILDCTESEKTDFVIMGGYGRLALVSFLLDTVADQVLRESRKPMLLCR